MLGRYWKLFAVCSVLWTSVFALGIAGTARSDIRMMFWAGITALVSCLATAWFIAICAACRAVQDERIEVEHLAMIMARVAREDGDVRPIR